MLSILFFVFTQNCSSHSLCVAKLRLPPVKRQKGAKNSFSVKIVEPVSVRRLHRNPRCCLSWSRVWDRCVSLPLSLWTSSSHAHICVCVFVCVRIVFLCFCGIVFPETITSELQIIVSHYVNQGSHNLRKSSVHESTCRSICVCVCVCVVIVECNMWIIHRGASKCVFIRHFPFLNRHEIWKFRIWTFKNS